MYAEKKCADSFTGGVIAEENRGWPYGIAGKGGVCPPKVELLG